MNTLLMMIMLAQKLTMSPIIGTSTPGFYVQAVEPTYDAPANATYYNIERYDVVGDGTQHVMGVWTVPFVGHPSIPTTTPLNIPFDFTKDQTIAAIGFNQNY